jgi:formylglycine-generating enzyme required for sulfatase activity
VERRGTADLELHNIGYFEVNDVGVANVVGNVWNWTESRFQNGAVTAEGLGTETQSDYCGVRPVEGKHGGFVLDFVRDVRSGGCVADIPPDDFGFRLVRSVS